MHVTFCLEASTQSTKFKKHYTSASLEPSQGFHPIYFIRISKFLIISRTISWNSSFFAITQHDVRYTTCKGFETRSPIKRESRSYSRSRSRSRSECSSDVENPGNNLYVTGLSRRVTRRDLEKHFSSEGGKVVDVHLVVDPWTRESRGFGFVSMSTVEEAERCLKHLDRSVLEGRVITVEKAKRRRGRTPTPGKYLGLKTIHVRRRSPSYSPYGSRSPSYSGYSSERERGRSYSPYYSRDRYYSRSCSPYSRSPRGRSYSSYYRSRLRYDRSVSPYYRSRSRYDRSVSPYYRSRPRYERSVSPYYRRRDSYSSYYRRRDRSISPYYGRSPYYRRHERSVSPYHRRRDRSVSPYYRGRDYSISPSPYYRRLGRSVSPYEKREYSRSVSPCSPRSYVHSRSRSRSSTPYGKTHSVRNRSVSRSVSPSSHRSYSRSRSWRSGSISSRSPTPEL